MKKITFILAVLLCSFVSFAQEVSLGLQFTPQSQLQGIPMASTPFSGEELPKSVDLSSRMPPAGDQGRQNSCVAWTVGYAYKSFQEKYEENTNYTQGGQLNKNAVFSPAFIYNQINNGRDGGSLFVDALNILSQQGAVKWSDMPYDESDYLTRPSTSIKSKAKKYKIDFWRRVNYADIKEVKAQLNAGFPVIIGAMIDRGFVDGGRNSQGQDYFWRGASGAELGGHAMLIVGYDDSKNAFKILNSWGQNWGKQGYCWITYNFATTAIREAFVMKDAINGTEENPNPTPVVVNPTKELAVDFQIKNVQHNLQDYQLGQVMRFDGMVDLPKGVGRNVQVVIRFYLNNGQDGKGQPVGSYSPYFTMPDGSAACGTPKSTVITGRQPWYASIPYQTLNVRRGGYNLYGQYQFQTTYLVAEPVLYIDDFAVKTGKLILFYVNL
jgi:hypothetical protein